MPHTPGTPSHANLGEFLGDVWTRTGALNPMGQRGVGGGWIDKAKLTGGPVGEVRHEDNFAPLVMGRAAGSQIEDFVRLSSYLSGLRRGLSLEQAGELPRRIHFDYTDLTPFERNTMKAVAKAAAEKRERRESRRQLPGLPLPRGI